MGMAPWVSRSLLVLSGERKLRPGRASFHPWLWERAARAARRDIRAFAFSDSGRGKPLPGLDEKGTGTREPCLLQSERALGGTGSASGR